MTTKKTINCGQDYSTKSFTRSHTVKQQQQKLLCNCHRKQFLNTFTDSAHSVCLKVFQFNVKIERLSFIKQNESNHQFHSFRLHGLISSLKFLKCSYYLLVKYFIVLSITHGYFLYQRPTSKKLSSFPFLFYHTFLFSAVKIYDLDEELTLKV